MASLGGMGKPEARARSRSRYCRSAWEWSVTPEALKMISALRREKGWDQPRSLGLAYAPLPPEPRPRMWTWQSRGGPIRSMKARSTRDRAPGLNSGTAMAGGEAVKEPWE